MAAELFRRILTQRTNETGSVGVIQTSIDELLLVKLTQPVAKTASMLLPGICLVAQGQKNIYLGEQRFIYDQEHFLLGGCRLPVYAELKEASEERPYYGMAVLLNPKIVSQLILEYDRVDPQATLEKPEGLLVSAKLTDELLESVCRLLRILGDKADEAILGPSLLRQIYYVILKGEAGPYLKNAAFQHSTAHRAAPLINYLEQYIQEDVTIADLVKYSGMSTSALHDVFKQATTLSPMQYLKRLRLNHAHQLLMTGVTVRDAAIGSGYNSSTQFSREFKRLFGFPPREVVALQ